MQHLSQRNPQWSQTKLGKSSLTVGRYGCTTTCISMLSDYFNCYKSPKEIAEQKDLYTTDGLVLWNKLHFSGMKFDRREQGEHAANILMALSDPNRAVILQVDHGQHWVVATAVGGANDYVIIDPWTGAKIWLKKTYINITGAAYFSRK